MIRPPSAAAHAAARERLAALAKPLGALGRLEDAAAWVAACQDACPPRPLDRVRLTVLAGDHGVSHAGVSAYPREVTGAMVAAMVGGGSGAERARPPARRRPAGPRPRGGRRPRRRCPRRFAATTCARSSGSIDREDALSPRRGADRAGDRGGDRRRGDRRRGRPARARRPRHRQHHARRRAGRGDVRRRGRRGHRSRDRGRRRRARPQDRGSSPRPWPGPATASADPVERLAALGSVDLAAGVGFLVAAARAGVPVLLDGIVTVAELAVAEDLEPGRGRLVRGRAPFHRTGPAARARQARPGAAPRRRPAARARVPAR